MLVPSALRAEDPSPIQTVTLDPGRPLYIPTHPRVTTTIRFPGPIGSPEGKGFTENEERQPGEYLVTWTRGEAHLTVCPLEGAGTLNLNIPYRSATYVLYFYPVSNQLKALASLVFNDASTPGKPTASIQRLSDAPSIKEKANPSTAQALGLLDRLKLLSPQRPSAAAAAALGLRWVENKPDDLRTIDHGSYEIKMIALYEDAKLGAFGVEAVLRNKTSVSLALDSGAFSVRLGSKLLPALVADAPEQIAPGETLPLFLCFTSPPRLNAEDLRALVPSVQLRDSCFNPGARVIERFANENK